MIITCQYHKQFYLGLESARVTGSKVEWACESCSGILLPHQSRERERPVLNPALALGARIIRNPSPVILLSVLFGAWEIRPSAWWSGLLKVSADDADDDALD